MISMENLMTVVDRLDELQASSVGRRECSSTRQRMGDRRIDVHLDCRHIESALPTGDGLWPLPRHMRWMSRKVSAFARLCVFGGLCVDVTIGTPMVIFLLLDCLLTVFDKWYTVPIVKNTQNHWYTNCHRSTKTVPTV